MSEIPKTQGLTCDLQFISTFLPKTKKRSHGRYTRFCSKVLPKTMKTQQFDKTHVSLQSISAKLEADLSKKSRLASQIRISAT